MTLLFCFATNARCLLGTRQCLSIACGHDLQRCNVRRIRSALDDEKPTPQIERGPLKANT
jgi:hypothetical protein